jgi:hypothetical protein
MSRARTAKAAGAVLICALTAQLGSEMACPAAQAGAAGLPTQDVAIAPAPTPMKIDGPAASSAPPSSLWTTVPLWRKVLGISSTLVGLAAVGTGAYLLWYNTTCEGDPCPFPHDTALPGWLLVAGGAAASLGGITLILVPGPAESRPVARLVFSGTF